MFLRRKLEGLLVLAGALSLAAPTLAAAPAMAQPHAQTMAAPEAPRPEAGPAARPDDRQGPRPAIWLLADADTRIYLFGTIHILPPELQWRSAELDRIVGQADELVLEVAEDPREADAAALAQMMAVGKQEPLLARVSPERREALRRMIDELGLPIESFDGMQTWAAAMMISAASLAREYAGKDGSAEDLSGVEDALRADFARAQRPILGVETGEQQLAFLSGVSPAGQTAMLEQMVDAWQAGDSAGIAEPSEQGWARGDTAGVAAEMAELPPELFEILVTRRNARWTDWLIARLQRPGTLLFAVGAGHLAGRDSLQSMLAARGYTVSRLE